MVVLEGNDEMRGVGICGEGVPETENVVGCHEECGCGHMGTKRSRG